MAGVYFYVPTVKLRDIVDCGLKLSEWYDRELELPGQASKKIIRALVNPWDDPVKSGDSQYRCLRIEVDPSQCMTGDADLYRMGLKDARIMDRYLKSLVPLTDYRFGVYRNPECYIFTSILPESIEVTGKVQDIPVLFESSETLYSSNVLNRFQELLNDSGNTMVYAYCRYLESLGKMTGIKDDDSGLTLFIDSETDGHIVVKTPCAGRNSL
jgi:hypothetical protein